MRAAFVDAILEIAARDDRVVLLTADLGFAVLEPFASRFPLRFFNVGVAEQNMLGLATGLAGSGFIPYAYSIGTFASMRPYEFIRNGAVAHALPVRIVGVGAGFDYGTAGITHHSLEDVALMRVQPGLAVIAPADHDQARTALLATADLPGPVYYRLSKEVRPAIPGLDGRFRIDRVETVREGADVLFVAMGPVAAEAAAACEALSTFRVDAALAVVAAINPPPADDLAVLLSRFRNVISVEAHYKNGGLGSLVAEVIADRGIGCRLMRRGAGPEAHDGISGSPGFLIARHGLDSASLVTAALEMSGG
jgi:transketolase